MVALPGQLFYSTQIPVCLWLLARSANNGRLRNRYGESLFIKVRERCRVAGRAQHALKVEQFTHAAPPCRAWRSDKVTDHFDDAHDLRENSCWSSSVDGGMRSPRAVRRSRSFRDRLQVGRRLSRSLRLATANESATRASDPHLRESSAVSALRESLLPHLIPGETGPD